MIKVENIDVYGFESAIRGMRNPLNSWAKSDSIFSQGDDGSSVCIGDNDLKLMQNLRKAGSDHRKYLRMINVTMDITAPLYWWKEYDTYKVGTVANSCSTMHRITQKSFEISDFSCEHLMPTSMRELNETIAILNAYLAEYLRGKENYEDPTVLKEFWWQLIQILPTSYNQRRTVQLNYEVLLNMYHARKDHKLDEWREFCKVIESLPYFREICLNE